MDAEYLTDGTSQTFNALILFLLVFFAPKNLIHQFFVLQDYFEVLLFVHCVFFLNDGSFDL